MTQMGDTQQGEGPTRPLLAWWHVAIITGVLALGVPAFVFYERGRAAEEARQAEERRAREAERLHAAEAERWRVANEAAAEAREREELKRRVEALEREQRAGG